MAEMEAIKAVYQELIIEDPDTAGSSDDTLLIDRDEYIFNQIQCCFHLCCRVIHR